MELLQTAIEREGKTREFYLDASQKSESDLGQSLFKRLAKEEDFHAAKAREIDCFLILGENPLAIEESLDRGQKLRRIVSSVDKRPGPGFEVSGIDLQIVKDALQIEHVSQMLYRELAQKSQNEFEKRYFQSLIAEEEHHHAALVRYQEYLRGP